MCNNIIILMIEHDRRGLELSNAPAVMEHDNTTIEQRYSPLNILAKTLHIH